MFNTQLTADQIDAIEQYHIDRIEAVMRQHDECERIAKQNADIQEWEENG